MIWAAHHFGADHFNLLRRIPMLKLSTLLTATAAALALTSTAYAAEKTTVKAESTMEHSKNGGYDKTNAEKTTNASGTVSNEAETKLKVNDDGSAEKTTTSEHTNDPKGLMNKHTDKTVVKDTDKDGVVTRTRTRKVDGKTVYDSSSEKTK